MSASIGARLKQARQERRLTLQQVSEATRVRVRYLEALEADDLSIMPSAVQARGFLRIYTGFLGLDVEALIQEVRQAEAPPAAPSADLATAPAPEATPQPEATRQNLLSRLRRRFARRVDRSVSPSPEPAPPSSLAPGGAGLPSEETSVPGAPSEAAESLVDAKGEAQEKPRPKRTAAPSERESAKRKKKVPQASGVTRIEPAAGAEQRPRSLQVGGREAEVRSPRWRPGSGYGRARPEVQGERGDEAGALANVRDFNPLVASSTASRTSAEIFAEVGQELRRRREMLGLSLEEVERHLRVRAAFLRALEAGTPDKLPSPVQTRGMLASYAGFLDLNTDQVLLKFAEGLQTRHRERHGERLRRTHRPLRVSAGLPPLRAFFTMDLLFGGGVAILLVLFAIWGTGRVLSARSQRRPPPTVPPIAQVLANALASTPIVNVTRAAPETPLLATATLELPTLAGEIGVQVNLAALERTYLRVIVDGKVQFEGRTVPGSSYPFQAQRQIDVLVGNAAALKVTFNGRDLGLMGNLGEVIERVYTLEGVATPTGTPLPTSTPTPRITPTPLPTSTPLLTPSSPPTRQGGG